jgi:hypothetical protein
MPARISRRAFLARAAEGTGVAGFPPSQVFLRRHFARLPLNFLRHYLLERAK